MNSNYVLAALLSAVLLWLCSATQVEAPRIEARIVKPQPPALQVSCDEKAIVCRARERTSKVKANWL
jgi:hypothetical protein